MVILWKEFGLLAICFICVVNSNKNPTLEGYECTGGDQWKIAKFEQIFCYTKIALPGSVTKKEGVISKNYCGKIDKASHPASIHSLAENNFLEHHFTNGFIGLFQPGKGKYNAKSYRWEDGTPFSFVHWDKGKHLVPQPNNDSPIERLTRLRKNKKFHGWHDWSARDLDYIICKKPATKIVAAADVPETTVLVESEVATIATPSEVKTDVPKIAKDGDKKNVKIVENTYIIDTDPKKAIDIAFKWGKKKEEQKKDATSTTSATSTNSCSSVINSDAGSDLSNFKTLESGAESECISKTLESEKLEIKGGETKKTQSETSSVFTGIAVDTGDESDDEESSTSASSTMATTQEETKLIMADKTQNDHTKYENMKSGGSRFDLESASTQTLIADEKKKTTIATTQGTEEKKESKSDAKPHDISSLPRRVIFFRNGERMDRVFPTWIRQSNCNGFYRPYNTNQPSTLPKRRNGLAAWESDPPITEIGKIVAKLAGQSLRRSGHKINAIYSSPAFRCLETAQIIAKETGSGEHKIKIEPGLFDWCSFYETSPTFLTTTELTDAGISIIRGYRPYISKETLYKNFGNETKFDFYRRSHDVIHKILSSSLGTVIIIGHATTMDSGSRTLLELPISVPSNQHLDRLADRYPYCTSVILEQSIESGQWRLGKPLLPITFLNQTTKLDKKFMLRK